MADTRSSLAILKRDGWIIPDAAAKAAGNALDTRVARFDAAADCAAYSATKATFITNVTAKLVGFINWPTLARNLRVRYHSSPENTTAPYVAVVINAPDDAAAIRALSSIFFTGSDELTAAAFSEIGSLNTILLSKDSNEDTFAVTEIQRVDAVAIYGGTAAGTAALEVSAW